MYQSIEPQCTMQYNGWTNPTETLCYTVDAGVIKKMLTHWASHVEYHPCVSSYSGLSQYMLLHITPVPHISMLYSPHIAQHGEVCMCIKLRGPLLKQASQRQLPKQAHALFIFIYTTSYLLIMGSSHFHYCSWYDDGSEAHCAEIHSFIQYNR